MRLTITHDDATSPSPTFAFTDAYVEWLSRIEATYHSVAFCCLHRLNDRTLAARIGLRVVAGLLAKPTIFKFSGLPYSGRIGVLAEHWIVEARDGKIGDDGTWDDLFTSLREVSPEHQKLFVLTCMYGHDDTYVARALACDESIARERRQSAIAHFESLSDRAARATHPA